MKTTRRKALKILGLSTLAISFNPFVGCENPIECVLNDTTNGENNLDALNTVNKFCQESLSGNFYSKVQSLKKTNSDFRPGYDFTAVVNSYKVVESKVIGNSVRVSVEYDYVGIHRGNKFYFYNPQNRSNKIIAKYFVKNGVIRNGVRPIIQKELYKKELKNAIVSANSAIKHVINSSKKTHFLEKANNYNNILALLS